MTLYRWQMNETCKWSTGSLELYIMNTHTHKCYDQTGLVGWR